VTSTFYADVDGDGYGDPTSPETACEERDGLSESSDDCDDLDASIYPGAVEHDWDGEDEDCDTYDFDQEDCVDDALEDAADWVGSWVWTLSDLSGGDFFSGSYSVTDILLVAREDGTTVTETSDVMIFDVQIEAELEMAGDASFVYPFGFGSEVCDMYVGVVSVLMEGTVELEESGGIVTAEANLSPMLIDIPSDHASFTGTDCDLESIDLIASLFTELDLTAWVNGAMADASVALADQYESEIEYYVRWDCSE
jgi:hypothetical protein